MAKIDFLNQEIRSQIIKDIVGPENLRRKGDSFRRLDIYKKNQRKYILERILKDLSPTTVANMRTFTSINFTRKIIDAQASIYKEAPERVFTDATEAEKEQLDKLYKCADVDTNLKKANRYYKLQDQISVQVIPKDGAPYMRVLCPHHFDVVPDPDIPEKALAYVVSGFDKQIVYNDTQRAEALQRDRFSNSTLQGFNDNTDQKIADKDDYKSQLNYFVWWTGEYHFATDKSGAILDENNQPYTSSVPMDKIVNPIAPEMPFIDIVTERDFEYWALTGSNITDLQLDLGAQISDTVDVNFRQGYSQAILSAAEAPKSMQIGPHTLLFLKKDPKAEPGTQPEFEFATPTPDLGSSIKLTEMLLAMALSSEGLEADTIATGPNSNGKQAFTSGYERLLAQLEEFKPSQDDMELFHKVEEKLLGLLRLWSNALQNTTDINEEIKGVQIGEAVDVDTTFATPEMVQSQAEKEDSNIKLLEAGLRSRKTAIKEIYNVDDAAAEEIIEEIDEEMAEKADEGLGPDGKPLPKLGPDGKPLPPNPDDPNANAESDEDEIDDEQGVDAKPK